jgi:hypothetical protein
MSPLFDTSHPRVRVGLLGTPSGRPLVCLACVNLRDGLPAVRLVLEGLGGCTLAIPAEVNKMSTHDSPLIQRLAAIQRALMAHHGGGEEMSSATAGSEREAFLRSFLDQVFPAHRRFATGDIVDATGNHSGQVDVAIEYGFAPSFPMPSGEQRLFLADAIAMVIEVKSDLSKQWEEIEAKTRDVRALKRKQPCGRHLGAALPVEIPVVAVGYRGHNTLERLNRRMESTEEASRPDAALVIESGCFVGFNIKANGPFGLFVLCVCINKALNRVIHASPDLVAYVSANRA